MSPEDFDQLMKSVSQARELARQKPPIMGQYYIIYFNHFGRWIRQPGEAKCLGAFKKWVSYNHETVIEFVPVFIYQEAFLLASDCRYVKV